MNYGIIDIRGDRELIPRAAKWFSEKWGIPAKTYADSMSESADKAYPRWYTATEKGRIIGGIGVIENDFHERTDLAPNVCALFVEKDYRGQGIAGALLKRVCEDMHKESIDELYLLTDHTNFYERYGWEYLTDVRENGGGTARMYVHEYENINTRR